MVDPLFFISFYFFNFYVGKASEYRINQSCPNDPPKKRRPQFNASAGPRPSTGIGSSSNKRSGSRDSPPSNGPASGPFDSGRLRDRRHARRRHRQASPWFGTALKPARLGPVDSGPRGNPGGHPRGPPGGLPQGTPRGHPRGPPGARYGGLFGGLFWKQFWR